MTASSERMARDSDAMDWMVLLGSGAATPAQQAAFRAWIAADPANADAFAAASSVWEAAGGMDHLADPLPAEPPASVVPLPASTPRYARPRWYRRLPALAAAVAALLAIATAVVTLLGPAYDYETDIGELRDARLSDGSRITLGAKSAISVDFSDARRLVRLEAGEAFFDVAHDKARPFFVQADSTLVRVVGTRFAVHKGPDNVRVAVLSGVVRVTAPASPAAPSPEAPPRAHVLTAHQQLIQSIRAPEPPVVAPVDEPAPWLTGQHVYEEASLREVIADANRYSRRPIRIADPALGDLRVTAAFSATQLDSLLASLEHALPLKVRAEDDALLLVPAPSAGRM